MFTFFSTIKKFALILRDAFRELRQHEPLQIAAAASFFAVFALPPIVIIMVTVFGVFGSRLTISRDILDQLSISIDKNTISEFSRTVRNVRWLHLGSFMQAMGFLFLLFVATTFFSVIRGSLNQLWSIKLKKDNGILFMILQRTKSLAIILFAGILIFILLAVEARGSLLATQPFFKRVVFNISAMFASMAWFIVVFRYLADGRPVWKASVAGGVFAGLFFTVGKSVLRLILSYGQVRTIYGASTAMVLLLLFVFYSSLIFYYSACFVKVFSDSCNRPVLPSSHAIKFTVRRDWQFEEKN
jgi:membrane protein